jgi:hypothetical protein
LAGRLPKKAAKPSPKNAHRNFKADKEKSHEATFWVAVGFGLMGSLHGIRAALPK